MTVRLTPVRLFIAAVLLVALALSGAATSCTGDHRKAGPSFVTVR